MKRENEMTRQEMYEQRVAEITRLDAEISRLEEERYLLRLMNLVYLDDCIIEAELDVQAQSAMGFNK